MNVAVPWSPLAAIRSSRPRVCVWRLYRGANKELRVVWGTRQEERPPKPFVSFDSALAGLRWAKRRRRVIKLPGRDSASPAPAQEFRVHYSDIAFISRVPLLAGTSPLPPPAQPSPPVRGVRACLKRHLCARTRCVCMRVLVRASGWVDGERPSTSRPLSTTPSGTPGPRISDRNALRFGFEAHA